MKRIGGLAAYVTSHGFGHLNRTIAVLNRLPTDIPLTLRCHPDLFPFCQERLTRPADLAAHDSDAGAVNPPGDSAATDGPATIARASVVHPEAMGRVDLYAQELRDDSAAAVLSDASPVPLVAARRAGVPGYLLANFTWSEIYAPHARRLGGTALALVAEIRAAYRQATAVFRAEPAMAMREIPRQISAGLVVSPGRDRGAELRSSLGLSGCETIVYMYLGRYGQDGLGWERLASLERSGYHFVGFHEATVGPLPNLHVVPAEAWTGADLSASADVMVVKAGYGTVSEAMASGTPMIYPPRVGFAEHRVLDRALRDWGGGLPVSSRAFAAFRIERVLDQARSLCPGPPPYPADGARRVADHLTALCRGRDAA